MRHALFVALVLGGLAGAEAALAMLKTFSFYIVSAHVAPGKKDGTAWDGMGRMNDEQKKAVKNVVAAATLAVASATPVGASIAAAGLLSDPALLAGAKPDVFGWFQIAPEGRYDDEKHWLAKREAPKREFTPTFSGPPGLQGLPWNEKFRIRITLIDKDAAFDDPIATVVIEGKHLKDAYKRKKQVPVLVAEQSYGTLLSVMIEVTD